MNDVCVLMTVYWGAMGAKKGEFLLRRAIESILCQTYADFWFFIISDDPHFGERERIELISRSYKDHRIDCCSNGKNLGLTETLNVGLDLINEPFIMRQDADDFSHPQRMEKQLEAIKQGENIGAVGDNYGVIKDGVWTQTNGSDPGVCRISDLAGSIAGCSMFRTSVIKEIGGWKYEYAQDFYMLVRMRQLGYQIKSLKETLYFYNLHPDQISQAKHARQKECHRQIVKEVVDGFDNSSDEKQSDS